METFVREKKIVFAMMGLPARGKVFLSTLSSSSHTLLELHFNQNHLLYQLAWIQC